MAFIIFALSLSVVVIVTPVLSSSDVLVFTDRNFQTEVMKHDVLLVEFYAPWCGHCKKLAPEYEKAAAMLKRSDPPVPLAKVDCTVETSICSKYDVSGYPALKIFKEGEFSKDFDGDREAEAIVKKMNKEAGPVSRELLTVEDAHRFLQQTTVGVIGFLDSDQNTAARTFLKVADELNHLRYAHTNNTELRQELNQTKQCVVIYKPKVLQSQFEEPVIRTFDFNRKKLKNFLETESLGLCAERNQLNAAYFEKPLVVAYYGVNYLKNPKGTNYWRNRVMKVAKKVLDEGQTVSFAISDVDDMSRELDECGITDRGGEKPVVCGWKHPNSKYRMDDEFSVETFEVFVNNFVLDKLEAYIKSDPIPVSNDEPVKVVVAKNFAEIVNDESKDVMIELYAPWCGHCKTLAPKYEELAEKLKKEKDIVIAKMDATSNDVPPAFPVNGFPTIYFATKFAKTSPKKYEGERELVDLLKYIAKEATDPLIVYDRSGNKVPKKKKVKKEEL